MKKLCLRCNKKKRLSEFGKNSRYEDGLNIYCKDCESKRKAEWRKSNPDYNQEYYINNKQKFVVAVSQWVKNNHKKYSDIHKAAQHRRRARLRGSGGSYAVVEWENLKKFYDYTCLDCGFQEPRVQLTPDHVIPVSKGGKNSIENIQPLCLSCNMKKGTKTFDYRPLWA